MAGVIKQQGYRLYKTGGELWYRTRQLLLSLRFAAMNFTSMETHTGADDIRIKCVVQLRNEIDVVEDWLLYHLYLFGDGNVYVLDDASNDGTETVLRRYAHRAVIRSVAPEDGGLYKKRENLSAVMQEVKEACDFVVPLDADEFVCLENAADRETIRATFARLDRRNWGIFKFYAMMECYSTEKEVPDPVVTIRRFFRVRRGYHAQKVFFSAASVERVGEGQHTGYSHHPNKVAFTTRLCLVHFNWRGLEHIKQKCLKGAAGFNYWKEGRKFYGKQYFRGHKSLNEGSFDKFVHTIRPGGTEQAFDLLALRVSELRREAARDG